MSRKHIIPAFTSPDETTFDVSRVAVCGGRDFTDLGFVAYVLDELQPVYMFSGGATGADLCAHTWALARCKPFSAFDAPWMHGKSAGPLRNGWMIDYGLPTLLVAFPGDRGTLDAMHKATLATIPVYAPTYDASLTIAIDSMLAKAYEQLTGSRRYRNYRNPT